MDTTDHHAAAEADQAMSGPPGPMAADPHLRLTPRGAPSRADSARAMALVVKMRETLGKYRDMSQAQADGFRQFLPGVRQPVYHFTSWRWALAQRFRFDPARPTSLLYREGARGGGTLELVGAMYTAPAGASLEELDRRVPLSVARWHEHVNWCVPPLGERERWLATRSGQRVFGPQSPIATPEACADVGGRFLPRVFGWMVHVQAFVGDDPRAIWGAEAHHTDGGR